MALSLTKIVHGVLKKIATARLHVCEPSTSACKCAFTLARNLALPAPPVRPSSHSGYYVLFPLVPDATPENNRFVANICSGEDWPALTATPQELYEGTTRMLYEYGATVHECMERLEKLEQNEMTFENVIKPFIDEEHEVLYAFHTLWLRMLTDWPESPHTQHDFMKIQELAMNEITLKWSNANFFKAVKVICEKNIPEGRWEHSLAEFYYLQMKVSAVNAKDVLQAQYVGHDNFVEQGVLRFRVNISQNTPDDVIKITDREMLKDAPVGVLKKLAEDKENYEKGPWQATLSFNSMKSIMTYCADKGLRATLWDKWTSRAGQRQPFSGRLSNSRNIEAIRRHQGKKAVLLGFSTYSDYRLAYKMAESPEIVRKLIKALSKRLRPLFDDRMEAWTAYAVKEEGVYSVVPSDLYYYCRKEAEDAHDVNPLDAMFHFPFWPTFENLLEILSYIFSLKTTNVTEYVSELCHPDAKVFSVDDISTGLHLGRVYVDPFERMHKSCGWDTLLGRTASKERNWDKIVYIISNLAVPSAGPTLLHYSDLESLLFQTGRALQLLLSHSSYHDITIPWNYYQAHDADAQDLLPTFVQFFAYKPMLLSALASKHLRSGAPLTEKRANDIALGISKASFYESYRALFWADFDLTLFDMKDGDKPTWQDVYMEKYREYFPFKQLFSPLEPCSFAPIFARNSSMSMYYARLWDEMLALDIHDTFDKEDDVRVTGERFKNAILYNGASEAQRELFRRFQSRDPSPDAMCDFYDPPTHMLGYADSDSSQAMFEAASMKSTQAGVEKAKES